MQEYFFHFIASRWIYSYFAFDQATISAFESTFEFLMARYLLLIQTAIYATH